MVIGASLARHWRIILVSRAVRIRTSEQNEAALNLEKPATLSDSRKK
jgi:hypothetical protein